jgi:enamine deaminase RidA (YjgF/YER057c/UK114 family)
VYPFERFTNRAKKVLTLAQEEAERAHHSYIGTEHLLLGLMREGEGLAGKALDNLGVEINEVRTTIESVLGRNEKIIIKQTIPTSRVKKVVELSFEEARKMGNPYVGTEHLLLGILVEGEGIAAHVLQDLGATLEKVRGEIQKLIKEIGVEPGYKPEGMHTPSVRRNIASGTSWEPVFGYSRAVRVGRVVYVSGTTATDETGRVVGEGDAHAQAVQALANIAKALEAAGASLKHVVRTRVYLTNIDDWEKVARAHKACLGENPPATTLVEVRRLIDPAMLVEIEAEAVIQDGRPTPPG